MCNDIVSKMDNGLLLSVDWLEFTVLNGFSPSDIVSAFGLSLSDFQTGLNGAHGYKSRMLHNIYSISLLYDGNDGMGVHVSVSGSAVGYFVECYEKNVTCVPVPFGGKGREVDSFDCSVLSDLLEKILDIGNLTRLDLAIDDKGCHFYGMDELSSLFSDGLYVSRFKTFKETKEVGKGGKKGHTIYFGSRKSVIMLRIYDKKLEQHCKGNKSVSEDWTRWEIELHKERAKSVALFLIGGSSLSDVSISVLSWYLRFIKRDNVRDTRCSISEKWELFLDGIQKVKISQPVRHKTLSEKKDWLRKQVAPTLAVIYDLDGDLGFIYDLIENGSYRLSAELRDLYYEEMVKQGYDFEKSVL